MPLLSPRRLAAAALLTLGLVSPAGAADLGAAPRTSAVTAPAYDWSGFYAGLHVGYRWGGGYRDQFNFFYATNGVAAGPYLGYNWQFSKVVVGLEGDWSFTANSLSSTNFAPGFLAPLNGFGTLRGRLGVAFDRVLVYGTAGAVIASQTYVTSNQVVLNGFLPRSTRTHLGWTAGAGIEAAVTETLVARAEYLYVNPGSRNYNIGGGDWQASIQPAHVLRVGLAYKFTTGGAVVARY